MNHPESAWFPAALAGAHFVAADAPEQGHPVDHHFVHALFPLEQPIAALLAHLPAVVGTR